jgi:hypothetical protein
MVDNADIVWGSSCTTRRPSPGEDEEGGKGEVIASFLGACLTGTALFLLIVPYG